MSHESSISMSHRSLVRVLGVAAIAIVASAHIGSPNVFFTGKAGPYDVRVTIRPPMVVPGVASVTVRAPADVQRVSIRPVYWRAGSKGAPSADETRRLEGQSAAGGTYEGSLWLMARGAYSVDVIVSGARGDANVLVPIASVATGRLAMDPALGAVLAVFGVILVAGLVTIVYKAAGESLLSASEDMEPGRLRNARRVAAITIPILGLAIFGGARWWNNVDRDYERTLYRASPLKLTLQGSTLELAAVDSLFLPGGVRVSALIPDHGKMMHLFLVKSGDAGAFAHLHPTPIDSGASPTFRVQVPALPAGTYHVYGDVVHETGFERTLVGTLELPGGEIGRSPGREADQDDAWFVGPASTQLSTSLGDGSTMQVETTPSGPIAAGQDVTLRITVRDAAGTPAPLEPYLGMSAHGVVTKLDGSVYVHLHPMGTITKAAQDVFLARDAGDTTATGMPRSHAAHVPASADSTATLVEFPYAFPSGGNYRLFVQVKRGGRILTGAFALPIADPAPTTR